MKLDYHVHLEEGPYSTNWLARTAKALAFFKDKDLKENRHSLEWIDHLSSDISDRIRQGCYSEAWLDLYLERAKQLGLKEVGIVEHLYRFQECLDYFTKHMHLEADELGSVQARWLNHVATIPSMNEFIEFIQSQQEKWKSQGVTLRLGLEADFFLKGKKSLNV